MQRKVQCGRQEGALRAGPSERPRVPEPPSRDRRETGGRRRCDLARRPGWQGQGEPGARRPLGLPAARQCKRLPAVATRLFGQLLPGTAPSRPARTG